MCLPGVWVTMDNVFFVTSFSSLTRGDVFRFREDGKDGKDFWSEIKQSSFTKITASLQSPCLYYRNTQTHLYSPWLCYSRSFAVSNAKVGESVQIVRSLRLNLLLQKKWITVLPLCILKAATGVKKEAQSDGIYINVHVLCINYHS